MSEIKDYQIMSPIQFYKCLADDTRLRCLLLIEQEGELCVCELMAAIDDIQPKISRHLAQLRKCDLLVDRRQGQWVYYRINSSLPIWAKSVLSTTLANNRSFIINDIERLQQMNNRPDQPKACC